jgi:hypothetical protein
MNPSPIVPRAITMAPIGRKQTQAPQRRMAIGASQPRRTVLNADQTASIGTGYAIPVPQSGARISMPSGPSITKRKGVDSMVLQGASKRQQVDLGGSSPAEYAALRATQLGRTSTTPRFNDSEPRFFQQGRGNQGLPVANNLPPFTNPLPMNVNYSRTVGAERIIFQGMESSLPMPSVATMSPAFGVSRGLAGTSTTSQFMNVDSGGTPRGGSGPDIVAQFNAAAGNIEKKTKTGSPNARTTYTHTLNEMAAAYAAVAQEKMIWIVPILIEDGAMTFDGKSGQLQSWGVDIQHAGHNLAVANYMLALSQPFPRKIAEIQKVENVLSQFRYAGVVASEEGATKSQYVDKEDAHIHRNIVMTLQGEVDVYNYWGDVKYGQSVGLIVKGVPLKDIFAHHYINAGTFNIDAVEPAAVRKVDTSALSNNPIQYVPWFDEVGMSEEPDISELEYGDDFGIVRTGVFIRVGTVIQVYDEVANEAYISRAPYSVAATVKTGLLRILVTTF